MKKKERLTDVQITELQNMIKSQESDNVEMRRAQAILLVNQLLDQITIESVTGYSKKYAFRLKDRYQKKGWAGIATKKRKPRLVFTKNQLEELKTTLKTKSPKECKINADFWTIPILAKYIKDKYNIVYKSKTSYNIIFKKANFSYHKPEKQYKGRKKEIISLWEKEKLPLINAAMEDPKKVVLAEDEMILTTKTTTQKVWLPIGKEVNIEDSNKRERRCVYGFLNAKTGQEHAFKTHHANSENTCKVLMELIKIYPDYKITILWDNASWHKSAEVKKFLEKNPEKFYFIPFPPYAPEKNPQEHVWKEGRSAITHNKFIENIDIATDELVGHFNSKTFNYKFFESKNIEGDNLSSGVTK